jgi:hypothetical protein
MEEKEKFGWYLSVTAPKEYPVEVDEGYLATKEKLITAIFKIGVQGMGWRTDEQGNSGGGSTIPSKLSLTWVSYAEKKFWTIDTNIDSAKMLSLFRQGFMFTDRLHVTKKVTYKGITIGLAPGGVVVLWLVGDFQRTEVGRYQAKETFVKANVFIGSQGKEYATQQEFYDEWYRICVPQQSKEQIARHGIPFGLWDAYRVHYNYKFRIQFYKEDKEDDRYITYLNGEETVMKGNDLNSFISRPLPWRVSFYFTEKWAETEFDEIEIMTAFKELIKQDKNAEIEIVCKVGFMYNDMEFWIESNGKKIPLTKVKVKLWVN